MLFYLVCKHKHKPIIDYLCKKANTYLYEFNIDNGIYKPIVSGSFVWNEDISRINITRDDTNHCMNCKESKNTYCFKINPHYHHIYRCFNG